MKRKPRVESLVKLSNKRIVRYDYLVVTLLKDTYISLGTVLLPKNTDIVIYRGNTHCVTLCISDCPRKNKTCHQDLACISACVNKNGRDPRGKNDEELANAVLENLMSLRFGFEFDFYNKYILREQDIR
jgi:hypothetical protein